MRKLIIIASLIVGITTFGQKHGVKLNLTSLISPGFIEAQYEHSLSENISFQVGAGYGIRKMRFINALRKSANVTDGETNPYEKIKTPAFRLTGEVKFFTGENGPQGLYIAPFIRYYSYSLKSSFKGDVNDNPDTQDIRNFKLDGNVNAFALGIGIGSQWIIEDKWAIDVMWFGVGYGAGNITVDYTSDTGLDWDQARDDLKEEVEKSSFKFIKDAEVSSKSNGIELSMRNPLPLILRSSISVGYFF